MKIILDILLVIVPVPLQQDKIPTEMNSISWFLIGAIVAVLLLVYLVIALVKPEKF